MLTFISEKVNDQDLFGYPIVLNFDKKAGTHNTICGGAVSIVIKTLMALYTFIVVQQMLTMDNDRWISITWAADAPNMSYNEQDSSLVDIRDMDQVSLSLGNARSRRAIKYDENTRRHIRIFATNVEWTSGDG